MSEEESLILDYLKSQPQNGCNKREIARRAVHRSVYEENPRWVDAPIQGLLNANLIQMDKNGSFHLPGDKKSES